MHSICVRVTDPLAAVCASVIQPLGVRKAGFYRKHVDPARTMRE
jgi:hypothetical protein